MRLLLDTHIALWAVLKSDTLSSETKDILLSESNEIFYSVISLWEVSLKHSINSENMEIDASAFRSLCQESGFTEVPVEYHHVLGLDSLVQKKGALMHKDPFDRILLSQALVERMHFVTHDSKIATFETENVILV